MGGGGVLVELARDVGLRLLPVAARQVGAMIDGLKLKQLLAGYRGRAAADRAALEQAALALAQFYLDHRSRIADVEINPLMVRSAGAIAVDVRVVWRDRAFSGKEESRFPSEQATLPFFDSDTCFPRGPGAPPFSLPPRARLRSGRRGAPPG